MHLWDRVDTGIKNSHPAKQTKPTAQTQNSTSPEHKQQSLKWHNHTVGDCRNAETAAPQKQSTAKPDINAYRATNTNTSKLIIYRKGYWLIMRDQTRYISLAHKEQDTHIQKCACTTDQFYWHSIVHFHKGTQIHMLQTQTHKHTVSHVSKYLEWHRCGG